MRCFHILTGIIVLWGYQPALALPPSGSVDTHLKPHVERLYLNHKQLKNIHKKLHDITITSFQGPEKQSSYIRQTNLFINEANLMCWNQWEMFSMTPYVKDEHKIERQYE